jgi:autotransporter strand-loop-strand O-heptosyltransferase
VKPDLIYAHTSFLGHNGYNNHSREFFTALNNHIPVRIRNYTHIRDLSYLTQIQKDMIVHQTWVNEPFEVGTPFDPSQYSDILNIVLNETHHFFFYDEYKGPKIAYNVWESTRQPDQFFKRILEYDQFWCPTEWQKIHTIEQGYPADRVFVVPEGVDGNFFKPKKRTKKLFPGFDFVFFLPGRWDYRKSIAEIIQSFAKEFSPDERVALVINVDNPFRQDKFKTTEEALEALGVDHPNIIVEHFMPYEAYLNYLQTSHCVVTCARSEGWNLPLIEAIACGTPTICSDWSGQLEFAKGISHTVKIKGLKKPEDVFILGNNCPGEWAEPDFDHLRSVMRDVYVNYNDYHLYAKLASKRIAEKYTWDNAAIAALQAIDKLNINTTKIQVPETVENPVKLNVGCGNDIKPGYINIDYLNNKRGVDLNADLMYLPFKDNCVDEIFMSHTLEHVGIYGVPKTLIEFNRVMKKGAKLVLKLPDLESCVDVWKRKTESEKYSSQEYIFGGQSHGGDIHMNGFTEKNLQITLERYGFRTVHSEKRPSFFGEAEEIYNISNKFLEPTEKDTRINCHFVGGPFIEILGVDTRDHDISFFDKKDQSSVHRRLHPINMWTRPARSWQTDWEVTVRMGDKIIFKHDYDPTGKRVLITIDSKSLGDTIAWVPYAEEFRKKNKCHVSLSTFWNKLFQDEYQTIEFLPPGSKVPDLYASFSIGCFDGDYNKNKVHWMDTPMQKIACDILGLDYVEVKPKIVHPDTEKVAGKKLVTLSEFSTAGCKLWQHPEGWQKVVDFLKENGYDVAVISKEQTNLQGIIDWTNKPIEQTIINILASDFFMGVSSGPSWLAWALNVPVVLISGSTYKWSEFQSGVLRILNDSVCHGCFTDSMCAPFDRGNWNWCPRLGDGIFECTKAITPEYVIESIEKTFLKNPLRED